MSTELLPAPKDAPGEIRRHDAGSSQLREQSLFLPIMSFGQVVARRDMMVKLVETQMVKGIDFGTIPGVAKPSLWKPGAEKLGVLFGLVATTEELEVVQDWTGNEHGGEPFFYFKIKCRLWRGDIPMGEGVGSCNSWEAKYRYRKAERVCPKCGAEAIIKGKQEYGGGWLCWKKKDGCGAKFNKGDQTIESQDAGRKANPDVYDQVNTCLKMAKKRANIDAIISTVGASEFFTQDVEDIAPFSAQPNEALIAPGRTETHEQLTQRRIDEDREKLATQRAKRPPAPTSAAPPAPSPTQPPEAPASAEAEVPPKVAKVWAVMTDMKSSIATLLKAKAKLKELLPEHGESEYYRVLDFHGAKHANEFQEIATMKRVARDLLSIVETAQAMDKGEQPKEPYQAIDDDIPF